MALATLACALALPAPAHADADDDLPRIMRTRELKREGNFQQALAEATALYEESASGNRPSFEVINRRVQMETLQTIVAMPPEAQAEIVEAEQAWWRGWELYGEGKYHEAVVPSLRALELREKHFGRHHHDVATSVEQLGLFRSLQNRYELAEPLMLEALQLYTDIVGEGSAAAATAHNNLATMYSAQADYARAEEHFRIHLRLFQENHWENEEEIASALSNLAVTLAHRGDPGTAEHLLSEALRIRRRIHPADHPSISLSLNLMGSNCWARGDGDNAEALYREALALREKTLGPDHPSVAVSLTNLAVVFGTLGRREESLAMHERALSIRMERYGERHRTTARSLQNIGDMQWKLGRPDLAREYFARARATTVEIHNDRHPGVASIDRGLARIEAGEGNLAEAERLFRNALEIYRETYGDAHREVANVLVHLGRLDLRREEWARAAEHFEAASRSHEAVRERFESPLDRASFQSSPDLLLATALLELGRRDEAWPHVERAHGRLLVDLVQMAPPEVAGTRRSRAANYGRPTTMAEVQATLPANAAMIGWVDVDDGGSGSLSWAWILRSSGPARWVKLDPAPRTRTDEDLAGRLREALVLAGSWPFRLAADEQLRHQARTLGANRLGPLIPHLEDVESLLVVPSGPLQGVPVESLLDEDNRPFGARWTVSYTPSPTVHAWLAGAVPGGGVHERTALLLGDPPTDEAFAALPGARDEVAQVGRFFPSARVLLGEDASERALVELASTGELASFGAIHLATHAIADPDRPERSALVLSAEHGDALQAALSGGRMYDGFLTVDEIGREWRLDADLVTLSGCGTALGKQVAGQGFLGFAHAFFQAGARSLVLSLWKVDDQATSLLMARFYENLTRRDLRKADALKDARQWLRTWEDPSGETPFSHPAYWSAFILLGDPGGTDPG